MLRLAVLIVAAAFVWLALAVVALVCIDGFSRLLQEKRYQSAVRRGVKSPSVTNSDFSGLRARVSGRRRDARTRRVGDHEQQG